MHFQITGNHLELSPKSQKMIQTKLERKLEKLLARLSEDQKTASVVVSRDKYKKFAITFDMALPQKNHIFAQTQHIKLLSAVIDLRDQVEKQIKRYKQTLVSYSLS